MVVLICHAGRAEGKVWEMITALDAAGHETWLDEWALAELDWQDEIEAILTRTKLFLYVISRETVADQRRDWVVERVLESQIPVVAIRYDASVPLPDALRGAMTFDFTDTGNSRNLGELVSLVQHESRSRTTADLDVHPPQEPSVSLTYRDYVIIAVTVLTLAISLFTGRAIGGMVAPAPEELSFWARLFSFVYRIGSLGIFAGMTVVFVLVRSSLGRLAALLAVEASLSIGYLVTPGADAAGLILALVAALCAYFMEEMHLLEWPWLSYQLARAQREYEQALHDRQPLMPHVKTIIRLLDVPVAVPLAGASNALQLLADSGVTMVQFGALSGNPALQDQYQQHVYQISMEKLAAASSFEAALEIIQAYQILPLEARTQIKVFLQKYEHAGTSIEVARAYGQFVWYFEELMKHIHEQEDSVAHRAAYNAVHMLVRLAYRAIRYRDAADYWMAYRWLEAISDQIYGLGRASSAAEAPTPRDQVRRAVLQFYEAVQLIQNMEPHMLHKFPEREQRWQIELATTSIHPDQLLTMDYQERQDQLTREIRRLNMLHHSQPASWLTIDRTASQVESHANPWCLITMLLIQMLEQIRKLDVAYVQWAERQLTEILSDIQSLNDLAELEQQLAMLEIAGDSFGPMVDGTVRWLNEISAEARAALDWPQGTYQYRQSLINARQRLDDLRTWLNTRFNRAMPRQWATYVRRMSLFVEAYLDDQRAIDTSTYDDPYMVGNPIPPKRAALFKGRMELAERIVEWLRSENRPTLVLHGARRMGKTSFLLQLQNLMSGWHDSPLSIFVDGQGPGIVEGDVGFFYTLTRRIHTELRRRGYEMPRPSREEFLKYTYDVLTIWLEDEVLPRLGEDARLLVTIDEFEKIGNAIREGRLSEKVLDFLRHTVQHSENMLFLFCGVETIDSLGPNAASYFIGVQAIEISFLDRKAAEELIRNPTQDSGNLPEYSASVVREIIRLTNGQPYLIQAICSKIITLANDRQVNKITTTHLKAVLPEVFASGQTYFQNIWHDAGPEGQAILVRLAHGPAELTPAEVKSPVVRALVDRHVICRTGDEASLEYRIEIPLVQAWVRRQVPVARAGQAPARPSQAE
ncbi:MAG: hypothetical protein Kow0077_18050 [Anaerolineae bacterium]